MTDHHGPGHGGPQAHEADARRLVVVLVLLVAFMVVEIAGALVAHSLALLSDAAHLLADVGAIAASLGAVRLGVRPANARMTFGYRRFEILAATMNGVTLIVVGALIALGASLRLARPLPVHGVTVVVIAGAGVVVDVVGALVLQGARRHSLNLNGAFRHVMTDLAAYAATIVAGAIILASGFRRADAIASLVVVVLMAQSAYALLRPAVRILVEATPDDVDLEEVRRHIAELDEVDSVHDLHAWTLSSGLPILSAHVVVSPKVVTTGAVHEVLDRLQGCLAAHFDVEHSTFQLEVPAHLAHEHAPHD